MKSGSAFPKIIEINNPPRQTSLIRDPLSPFYTNGSTENAIGGSQNKRSTDATGTTRDETKMRDIGQKTLRNWGQHQEFKNIIGDEATKLRLSDWTNWQTRGQSPEYVDNLVTDLVDNVKTSRLHIQEEISNKENALKQTAAEKRQAETNLRITEGKVVKLEEELHQQCQYGQKLRKEATERENRIAELQAFGDEAEATIVQLRSEIAGIKKERDDIAR